MVTASEAAEEYRAVLSDLSRNDKTQINLLTILAEDYASYSNEIVKVIEDSLYNCSVPLKIVMLYVIDSIVKNVQVTGGYRELFAKKIVDMIVHVFKEGDERTRASIYRLRCTWADVFAKSRLNMIDIKINSVDRAWPIMNTDVKIEPLMSQQQQQQTSGQGKGGHVVHVNPKFLNGKQPNNIKQENVFSNNIKQEKQNQNYPEKHQPEKQEKQNQEKQQQEKQKQQPEKQNQNPDKQQPAKQKQQPEKQNQNPEKQQEKKKTFTTTKRPKTSETPPVAAKRSKTNLTTQQQPQHSSNISKPIPRLKQPRVSKQNVPEPSRALGAHAFSVVSASQQQTVPPPQKPMPLSSIILDQPPPQQQQQPSSVIIPPQVSSSSIISPPNLQQPPPPFIKEQPPPQIVTINSSSNNIGGMPQLNNTSSTFPSPIQNVQQHNIQNVTPRLPGVPENNRIFVDGKAYEVFYLDHVAVIERNGLPHRVSFAGPPRDVIVDGIGHRMSFGEHKQVLIDGEIHLLRFGAPSRELYMGNFPFKGAFGGPPIIATINGRRHEIRLCGPPPEVRIDPEPSYELMRYMPAIRQQQQQQPQQQRQIQQPAKVEAKKDPVLDVTSLLQRLKNSGILSQLNQAEKRTHERQAAIESRNTTLGRSNSPPVPCAHRFEHLERRSMPMAGFDLFSMRSLIIRYDSFIDSIHKQRRCCQHCGICFKELYGEAYQRHIDWHLQDTLKMKDSKHKYTRSQQWFMLEDWFTYSESELVNKIVVTENDKSQQRQTSPSSNDFIGGNKDASTSSQGGQQTLNDINNNTGSGVDATSDSIETKECGVCHEQFEEYWDEDEDVWRLRDCIVADGKAFHVYCREDATTTSSTTITEDK